ncbi:hypothetical protein [Falsirhodobacter deserti]|uniref:hypothetical protein n=1 Tax=Falsirhodobacter deserti TaxID=1365611 RepID=UPI000FE359D1|nr:hypothetical protein [Falsirhodobacter deserti]
MTDQLQAVGVPVPGDTPPMEPPPTPGPDHYPDPMPDPPLIPPAEDPDLPNPGEITPPIHG